ncbi:right-handed parallel beta-helix repeat-containing protein [Niallia sp. 01092]|uniref:right-handed parallel beta-helix repeat-containing protein n=1 Tax=unclassified Niallia TaxID=2837522 RepID=UPI003FD3A6F8
MKKLFLLFFSILFLFLSYSLSPLEANAAQETYIITPDTKPLDQRIITSTYYNNDTKDYFVWQSYLQLLEKQKGGTLIIAPGTYTISNALAVPSNVTIIFQDGTNIIKGNTTGVASYRPSASLFQLIRPSLINKKGVVGKHGGEKNIAFIGEGNVTIDMQNTKDGIAIIAGHNKNVEIRNITFQNMNSGHFIEMDATKQAVIAGNRFLESIPSMNFVKEAINLDTPDPTTGGFNSKWSKMDRTANKNIWIENNTFNNLDRAIGTHKFSEGENHTNIVIINNTIENMRNDAIRVMNWKNSLIKDNRINNVAGGADGKRGILVSGSKNMTIEFNTFDNLARPIQFMPWQNSGPGSQYPVIYDKLYKQNIEALKTNQGFNVKEKFTRINREYNNFSSSTTTFVPMN